MTWTAAACCRFPEAALLPPKAFGDQESTAAHAYARAVEVCERSLGHSTASRLASQKRQQAAAVQGAFGSELGNVSSLRRHLGTCHRHEMDLQSLHRSLGHCRRARPHRQRASAFPRRPSHRARLHAFDQPHCTNKNCCPLSRAKTMSSVLASLRRAFSAAVGLRVKMAR